MLECPRHISCKTSRALCINIIRFSLSLAPCLDWRLNMSKHRQRLSPNRESRSSGVITSRATKIPGVSVNLSETHGTVHWTHAKLVHQRRRSEAIIGTSTTLMNPGDDKAVPFLDERSRSIRSGSALFKPARTTFILAPFVSKGFHLRRIPDTH